MNKFLALTLITLCFTLNIKAQYIAKVSDFHEIKVEDTLTKHTIEKYVHYMETNPINYEKYITDIKEVRIVNRGRYHVREYKDGILYLNERLDSFPNIKRIMILQYLAHENGMRTYKKNTAPYVNNEGFYITAKTEDLFRRQFKRNTPYKHIVEELKKTSPLKINK